MCRRVVRPYLPQKFAVSLNENAILAEIERLGSGLVTKIDRRL
jgi:hypothetical protein